MTQLPLTRAAPQCQRQPRPWYLAALSRLIAQARARRAMRRSLGPLLARADDRALEDIGLNREDLRRMLDDWRDLMPPEGRAN
ncbi:hypothetical protein FGG78_28020 [Thioclava sp. BHET1]|nr:hypothetical protein FGG78_28020 [Thioclava sp. BHET1]